MGKNLKPFTIFHALYYSVKPYSQLGSSKHNLISVFCSVAYVGEQNKWFVLEMITTFRQETPCVPSTRKEVIVYTSMASRSQIPRTLLFMINIPGLVTLALGLLNFERRLAQSTCSFEFVIMIDSFLPKTVPRLLSTKKSSI